MRPRIGLTCDYQRPPSGNGPPRLILKTHYIDAVRNAGMPSQQETARLSDIPATHLSHHGIYP